MTFYQRYPMMRPYVGKDFHNRTYPSLLLVGESHYLPEGSTQHLDAARWYSATSDTLSATEIEWISTEAIYESSRANGFSNKAHSIWSNSLWEINEFGPRHADYRSAAENIACYNFFLRPAVEGKSLLVTAQDVEFANDAFRVHFDALKPAGVVFLSSLAYSHFSRSSSLPVPVVATPHPGCHWWNRTAGKYGDRRGRDILADFVKTLSWPIATTAP